MKKLVEPLMPIDKNLRNLCQDIESFTTYFNSEIKAAVFSFRDKRCNISMKISLSFAAFCIHLLRQVY